MIELFNKNNKNKDNEYFEKHKFCTECGKYNDLDSKYCVCCGHKLKKISKDDKDYKEYCSICGEIVNKNDNYCHNCGFELLKLEEVSICPVCGEWRDNEKYCMNCGHKKENEPKYNYPLYRGENKSVLKGDEMVKKCFNCGKKNPRSYNYCKGCGEKLVKKNKYVI